MKRRVLGPILVALAACACGDVTSLPPDAAPASGGPLSARNSLEITLLDLGVPFGASNSRAISINERGEVAGEVLGGGLPTGGFHWSPRTGFTDLGNLGGPGATTVSNLNASGVIVGASDRLGGPGWPQAYLWSAREGMRDLLPDATNSFAGGVSDNGAVAGGIGHFAFTLGNPQPFLWTERDGLILLDLLPDWLGAGGNAVNNGGEVVGAAKVPAGSVNEIHAFYWSAKTGMVDVGRVGPIPSSTGLMSINERGEAVGTRLDGGGFSHAIFWTAKDGLMDLELPGLAPTRPSNARSINEAGEIAGQSVDPSGQTHAVVWRLRGSPQL